MEFSNEYYARLIVMEGFRAKAYRCPSGVWTIGYGTTTGVKEGMVVNQNQAFKLLQDDSSKLERLINKLGVDFTQNQFDAIGLFCYNCGFPAFKSSTLFKVIKRNRYDKRIKELWMQWKYSKGKVLLGLERRREVEVNLYLGV